MSVEPHGTEAHDRPGGATAQVPPHPDGATEQGPPHPDGAIEQGPHNHHGTAGHKLQHPSGATSEEPHQPGGATKLEPHHPGGATTQEPSEPGGATKHEPHHPGGATLQETREPGGANKHEPHHPGGATLQETREPGGANKHEPHHPGGATMQKPRHTDGATMQEAHRPVGATMNQMEDNLNGEGTLTKREDELDSSDRPASSCSGEIDIVADKIRAIRMDMENGKNEPESREGGNKMESGGDGGESVTKEATGSSPLGFTTGSGQNESIIVYEDEECLDTKDHASQEAIKKPSEAAMTSSASGETPVKDGHVAEGEKRRKSYFTPEGMTPRQARLAWDAKENQSPMLIQYYQNRVRLPRHQRHSLPLTSISDSEVSYLQNETMDVSVCSSCCCQFDKSSHGELDDTNNESVCICPSCGDSSFTSVSTDQSEASMHEISQSQSEDYCTTSSSESEDEPVELSEEKAVEDENRNVRAKLPPFYTFHHLKYEDRCKTYKQILADCAPEDIDQAFKEHLLEAMWPCPWKAIWSSCITSEDEGESEEMFEVLVSVRKIYLHKEYAKVRLAHPFTCTNPEMTQCEFYTWLRMDMLNVVHLYEIYPIKDEGLNYLEPIAKAIDNARFFYHYLWRFWDAEGEDDYEWISRHLEKRLRLYYDIQEGKVPIEIKENFESMVIQANEKHLELIDLYSAVSMSESDADLEETELELTQCADDLKLLRDKLVAMEDPTRRLQVLDSHSDKETAADDLIGS